MGEQELPSSLVVLWFARPVYKDPGEGVRRSVNLLGLPPLGHTSLRKADQEGVNL